jgi:hypothetical protein
MINPKSIINFLLGYEGKIISSSKSEYRQQNPDNLVIFNANIIAKTEKGYEKIWYGDVDITLDYESLVQISENLDTEIFVLYEMDCRFDRESDPNVSNFVVSTFFNRENPIEINEKHSKYFEVINRIPKRVNDK